MRRYLILFYFILVNAGFGIGHKPAAFDNQQNILIRLFASYPVTSFTFFPVSGEYSVYGDTTKLFDTDAISFISISLEGDSLLIRKLNYQGKFAGVRIVPATASSSFKIKSVLPDYIARIYDDELKIFVQSRALQIINKVDIEKYTAGVVRWEVGEKNPQEFNKVKTIACRTYALGNWRRHEAEGFQLCDEVHCQVFKGKTFNKNIHEAAKSTAEYIMVDDSAKIVTSSFHSNCGGQTMNSEDVWSKAVACLRSVNDTFCLSKKNSMWEKRIPKDLWLDYIRVKYNYPVDDPVMARRVLSFDQPRREVYLMNDNYFIPLKFVREDMKLKSTFFTIKEEEGNVIFRGRGFGHGVGLCQEGAMRMAEKGYSYIKILNYYYSNIHLIRFSQLDFFKVQ